MQSSNDAKERYANLLVESVDSKLKQDESLTRAILVYLCATDYSVHKSELYNHLQTEGKRTNAAIEFLEREKLVHTMFEVPVDFLSPNDDGKIYSNKKLNDEFRKYNIGWRDINNEEFQQIMLSLQGEFKIGYNKTFNINSEHLGPLFLTVKGKLEDIEKIKQEYLSNLIDHPLAKDFNLSTGFFNDPTWDEHAGHMKTIKVEATVSYASLEAALKDGPNSMHGVLLDVNKKYFGIDKGYFPVTFNVTNFGDGSLFLDLHTWLTPGQDIWRKNWEYQKEAVKSCVEAVAPVTNMYKDKRAY